MDTEYSTKRKRIQSFLFRQVHIPGTNVYFFLARLFVVLSEPLVSLLLSRGLLFSDFLCMGGLPKPINMDRSVIAVLAKTNT